MTETPVKKSRVRWMETIILSLNEKSAEKNKKHCESPAKIICAARSSRSNCFYFLFFLMEAAPDFGTDFELQMRE